MNVFSQGTIEDDSELAVAVVEFTLDSVVCAVNYKPVTISDTQSSLLVDLVFQRFHGSKNTEQV